MRFTSIIAVLACSHLLVTLTASQDSATDPAQPVPTLFEEPSLGKEVDPPIAEAAPVEEASTSAESSTTEEDQPAAPVEEEEEAIIEEENTVPETEEEEKTDSVEEVAPKTEKDATEASTEEEEEEEEEENFWIGFGQAFLLVFVTEIGDRTFILVTIYAAKMSFLVLFLVSNIGMLTMHTISTLIGGVVTLLIPKFWTRIIVIVLFVGMGIYQLIVGLVQCHKDKVKKRKKLAGEDVEESDSDDERNEIEQQIREHEQEVQAAEGTSAKVQPSEVTEVVNFDKVSAKPGDLKEEKEGPLEGDDVQDRQDSIIAEEKAGDVSQSPLKAAIDTKLDITEGPEADSANQTEMNAPNNDDAKVEPAEAKESGEAQDEDNVEAAEKPKEKKGKKKCCMNCKNEYLFFLALLMCAEWGDKSQIAAIALAGNYGIVAILLGGGLAHTCTILIAYLLGKAVEKCCKEMVINIIGGALFIIFGLYELFFNLLFPGTLNIGFLGGEEAEEEALRFLL